MDDSRIELQCLALRDLAHRIADGASHEEAGATLAELRPAFLHTLALHRARQETHLFPALLESMAGSDAVCLREMATGLADEHQALDVRWRRLCDALEAQLADAPGHRPSPGLAADAEALLALCERHVAFENAELWPMAARLLGDQEMARLLDGA